MTGVPVIPTSEPMLTATSPLVTVVIEVALVPLMGVLLIFVPGVLPLLRKGYRWFAARRHRFSRSCAMPVGPPPERFQERSRKRRAT